jgi:hypothetical protein
MEQFSTGITAYMFVDVILIVIAGQDKPNFQSSSPKPPAEDSPDRPHQSAATERDKQQRRQYDEDERLGKRSEEEARRLDRGERQYERDREETGYRSSQSARLDQTSSMRAVVTGPEIDHAMK